MELSERRDNFIRKAKEVHDGEGIDYSEVVYVNNRTKVKLIDPLYGEFWQTPSNHLKGQGHPMRRSRRISSARSLSQDEVIKRFEEVHNGEGLDYSKVVYKNMHTKVCIIDPKYGEFYQEPSVHLKGCGHPMRAVEVNAEKQRNTTEWFVDKCRELHPSYSYDKAVYRSYNEKVCLVCPRHGEFWMTPTNLLSGKGCPSCGHHLSKGEDEIYGMLLSILGEGQVVKGDRTVLGGKEIDILIPTIGIGIEFDGLRWHSDKHKEDRNYHLWKTEKALEKGVRLIHVFEDEWSRSKDLVMSRIKHIVGKDDSVILDARNCKVSFVSSECARWFAEENSIDAITSIDVSIGAFLGSEMIGLMTFSRIGEGRYVLDACICKHGLRCRGLGGKLFSYFIGKYAPTEVEAYADRRWTPSKDGNLFTILGFKFVGASEPYGWSTDFVSRWRGDGNGSLIYDCGSYRYIWRD